MSISCSLQVSRRQWSHEKGKHLLIDILLLVKKDLEKQRQWRVDWLCITENKTGELEDEPSNSSSGKDEKVAKMKMMSKKMKDEKIRHRRCNVHMSKGNIWYLTSICFTLGFRHCLSPTESRGGLGNGIEETGSMGRGKRGHGGRDTWGCIILVISRDIWSRPKTFECNHTKVTPRA